MGSIKENIFADVAISIGPKVLKEIELTGAVGQHADFVMALDGCGKSAEQIAACFSVVLGISVSLDQVEKVLDRLKPIRAQCIANAAIVIFGKTASAKAKRKSSSSRSRSESTRQPTGNSRGLVCDPVAQTDDRSSQDAGRTDRADAPAAPRSASLEDRPRREVAEAIGEACEMAQVESQFTVAQDSSGTDAPRLGAADQHPSANPEGTPSCPLVSVETTTERPAGPTAPNNAVSLHVQVPRTPDALGTGGATQPREQGTEPCHPVKVSDQGSTERRNDASPADRPPSGQPAQPKQKVGPDGTPHGPNVPQNQSTSKPQGKPGTDQVNQRKGGSAPKESGVAVMLRTVRAAEDFALVQAGDPRSVLTMLLITASAAFTALVLVVMLTQHVAQFRAEAAAEATGYSPAIRPSASARRGPT